jgi:hypothetical protein
VVPHEYVEEAGLRQLRLYIYQDNIVHFRGLLLRNHLHGVFLFDDDLLRGSNRWCKCKGWHGSRGCGGIPSIVVILIISILIAPVLAILVGELHDELVARLDHSFQLGLLFP